MRKRKGTLTKQEAKKKLSPPLLFVQYFRFRYLALWFWGVYIYPQNKGIKCPWMSIASSTSIKF